MIEIEVEEKNLAGYPQPAFEFVCPMCDQCHIRDLSRGYVRSEVWRHLVSRHMVMQNHLSVVFVNKEALSGMEKTGELPDSAAGV